MHTHAPSHTIQRSVWSLFSVTCERWAVCVCVCVQHISFSEHLTFTRSRNYNQKPSIYKQRFGVDFFKWFWKQSVTEAVFIWSSSTLKTVILWNIPTIKIKKLFPTWIYCKMQSIPVMRSWIFSIITPVFRDPSEIILICWFDPQEKNLIIINVDNSCAASFFLQNSLMNRKL